MSKTDQKLPPQIRKWIDRLSPSLDSFLLPELVRLTAEYLASRHRWCARKVAAKVDLNRWLDEDGGGAVTIEFPREAVWFGALSEAPLHELSAAGQSTGAGTVSWTLRVEELKGELVLGVGPADTLLNANKQSPPGTHSVGIATYAENVPSRQDGKGAAREWAKNDVKMPPFASSAVIRYVTFDVDLGTGAVAITFVHRLRRVVSGKDLMKPLPGVQRANGYILPEKLAQCYIFAASGSGTRVTFVDGVDD